jgi:hypothetical protein
MRRGIRAVAVVAAVLCASVVGIGTSAAVEPLDLSPSPEVDEQLYLVYTLKYAYDFWPRDVADPSYGQRIDKLRFDAARYREYVKEKGFDPKLASLYDDLVSTIDAQKAHLVRSGAVRAEADLNAKSAGRDAVGGSLLPR